MADIADNADTEDLTGEIARFIVQTDPAHVCEAVWAAAGAAVVDGTGLMLAGRTDHATRIVSAYVESTASQGSATVVGTGLTSSAAAAALVNGTSAHAHDFDDTQISAHPDHLYGLLTHPTSPIWAATLAAAESAGSTGEEALHAYLIGIEVACRLCDAASSFHYIRGFHTTQTMSVFGATAAAARLGGLTVEQTAHAIGIATSLAAGIRVNFGSMTKPLHAGRAAESGIVAAQLARQGLTANRHALEAPGGFFKTFASDLQPTDPALQANPLWGYAEAGSPGFRPERVSGKLGAPWYFESPGLSIKPYPSVVLSHPSMNALLQILQTHDIAANDIRTIKAYAGPTVLHIIYRMPETGTQGKFSLVYCLALIALKRAARLSDFNDADVKSEAALQMMHKIELLPDTPPDPARLDTMSSRIEVELHDGRRFEQRAGPYKGGPQNPMTRAELDDKFIQCASEIYTDSRARTALDAVRNLASLTRIRELTAVLRAP